MKIVSMVPTRYEDGFETPFEEAVETVLEGLRLNAEHHLVRIIGKPKVEVRRVIPGLDPYGVLTIVRAVAETVPAGQVNDP